MNILFLDIDGVLNSNDFAKWRHEQLKSGKMSINDISQIDENAVKLLVEFIEKYNVKLVISSSWRMIKCKDTIKWLSNYKNRQLWPILPYIVGITTRKIDGIRGEEIQHFLDVVIPNISSLSKYDNLLVRDAADPIWKEDIKYAIVDDDADMLDCQMSNFVQTDFMHGLVEGDVQKLIEIFFH